MFRNKTVFLLSTLFMLLSACQSGVSPTAEATSTFAPTSKPTATPSQTPTLTNTPTPSPTATSTLPQWEGESWILTELKEENSPRVVSNTVVFEDGGETWRLELKNAEGVENIRLLEKQEGEYEYNWPVIVGEVNGETRAYDPLNEVFLPLLDGFEYLHDYAERAMQILVDTKEDVYSLEELETNGVIDWAKMDSKKEGGQRHYVERVYEDSTKVNLELRLYRGAYFRLYMSGGSESSDRGRFIDLGQEIYNANKSSDEGKVVAQNLFVYLGASIDGRAIKTSGIHPNSETVGMYYDINELNEILLYGSYNKMRLYFWYDRSTNKDHGRILYELTHEQNISDIERRNFIDGINMLKILPIDFVFAGSHLSDK